MFDAHRDLDLLYTALGWASNIALFAYAPFAKSWRRALLVQLCIVCSWAAVRFVAARVFAENDGPGSLYLLIVAEALVFAAVTRSLKLLLFKLPALKALEAHLRRGRPQGTPSPKLP